jgi:hypothetical protein
LATILAFAIFSGMVKIALHKAHLSHPTLFPYVGGRSWDLLSLSLPLLSSLAWSRLSSITSISYHPEFQNPGKNCI